MRWFHKLIIQTQNQNGHFTQENQDWFQIIFQNSYELFIKISAYSSGS